MPGWHDPLSGVAFRRWLEEVAGSTRVAQGVPLDPFETSMRNFYVQGGVATWLSQVREGSEPPERGGGSRGQAQTDLRKARLMDSERIALTPLGRMVLETWETSELDNAARGLELPRCLALVQSALRLQIPLYCKMYAFWGEVRSVYAPLLVLKSTEALYALSYLNQEVNGFNPWAVLKESSDFGLPNVTLIGELANTLPGATTTTRAAVERLTTRIQDFSTRGAGRQTYCLAMELVNVADQDIDAAKELLTKWAQ